MSIPVVIDVSSVVGREIGGRRGGRELTDPGARITEQVHDAVAWRITDSVGSIESIPAQHFRELMLERADDVELVCRRRRSRREAPRGSVLLSHESCIARDADIAVNAR